MDSGIGSADRTAPDVGTDASSSADAGPNEPGPSLSDAACADLPDASSVDPTSTPPLVVQGDPGSAFGIYDPSLIYGEDGGVLAYSSVALNSVHTRVAVTTNLGASFQYAGEPNLVTPVTVTTTDTAFCDAGTCQVSGALWHEVPSIVADPGDPSAPLKLFVHSYVSVGGGATLRRDWGYIGMQTATTPASWGSEQKLLGWASDATLSSSGATQVLSSLPELADCVAFTEPGALVSPLGLDLALDCAYSAAPGVVKIRVVLLRSTDHARSFSFVSTLVAADDFGCIDGTMPQIMGPDLFLAGGKEYVVVSPTGPISNASGGGYRACVTIPLADPDAGTIARGAGGDPVVTRWVTAADGRFTGPCTYAEGATALGLVVPMQFTDQAQPWFRVQRTSLREP